MPRDLAPALTLVETGKHRAAIGPEVESHRLAFVTRHGLPKNGEVTSFLRQSIAHGLPGLAAVSERHTAAAASGGKRPAVSPFKGTVQMVSGSRG